MISWNIFILWKLEVIPGMPTFTDIYEKLNNLIVRKNSNIQAGIFLFLSNKKNSGIDI